MSDIIMPKLGDAMTEGKVIRWYKQPGDEVKKGEPVLEIETDKVNLDLEAESNGVLGEHEVGEGETAQVGATLSTVGDGKGDGGKKAGVPKKQEKVDEGSDEPAKQQAAGTQQKPTAKADRKAGPPQPEAARPEIAPREEPDTGRGRSDAAAAGEKDGQQAGGAAKDGRRTPSSPLARRMARELGVDLGSVRGSGPNGRIVAADVESMSKGDAGVESRQQQTAEGQQGRAPQMEMKSAALESKDVPLTAMRRTIAKRLGESLGPIPHFFLTIDVDVTELSQLRKQVNEVAVNKVSVNDFIIRASALAIHQHPYVNSSFKGESIQQHGSIHVGVAVATSEGLITPVIRDADRKGVSQIAGEVRELADRAKNRKLKPEEYQGSTFTISNLGMFGIDEFTAIINPPNVAILAVGAAGPQPVVIDGMVMIRERMKITMSCDHRVIDGAAGAEYLKTLRGYLEQPLRMLV